MAYVNNGTSRSLKVSVNRTLGGVTVQGYPKTYDGQNYWGNPTYPTLTDTQMQQLSESDFAFRYADFVAYVESVESGLDFTYDIIGDGAIKTDLSCLTTTTTTRAATTTTTTTAAASSTSTLYIARVSNSVDDICSAVTMNVYSAWYSWEIGTRLFIDAGLTIQFSGYSFINIDGYGDVWEVEPSGLDSGRISGLSESACV